MKGIKVCSYKGQGPHQIGNNHKNVKEGWDLLNNFFSKTTALNLTRLGTSHQGRRRDLKFVQNKGIAPLQGEVVAKE
jgi:hypothetical protein